MATAVTARFIRERLRERYGIPEPPPRTPPLDEIVRTILSQNTNDRNRDRAYTALKARFPAWEAVLAAPPEDLIQVIGPAGLGPTKGRRIRDLLAHVFENGGRDLLHLCAMPRQEALRRLTSIKGVGPKTAACVLLFSCSMPAFPVDTHIYRVAGRLGLLPGGVGRVKAHDILAEFFPEDHYLEIHINLIKLGRQLCRPSRPDCGSCPLAASCPSSASATGGPYG